MGMFDWFKIKDVEKSINENVVNSSLFYLNEADIAEDKIKNGFVGEVEQKKVKFPQELGEEHPFDFKQCEGVYEKFGFITAAVDKITDFIVGPGFYVECEDERAKEIIEQFMQDVNLDTLLRSWIKEGLVKGNGFLEIGGGMNEGVKGLKCLNANWMYVDRDKKGVILRYNQYKGGFDVFAKDKVIPFEPYQIAHIALNKIGDNGYGCGVVNPSLTLINNLLQNQKDLHMLMSRKANSPYDISIGKVIDGKYHKPSEASIKNLGKDLEWLHNKHEWVHDAMIDIKALDFGNIGDKFSSVLNHDLEMLFYSLQIPAVLMGKANIPEGLAGVQMDAFERRIQSIQAEVEKVIENQIFKRVLNSNGLDVHVEFQWGRPSSQEKLDRMLRLTELMKIPTISQSFFKLMEKDLVKMLDYNEDEYETMSAEEEKKRELERPQPLVPGQNRGFPQVPPKVPVKVQQKPVKQMAKLDERWVTIGGRKVNIGKGQIVDPATGKVSGGTSGSSSGGGGGGGGSSDGDESSEDYHKKSVNELKDKSNFKEYGFEEVHPGANKEIKNRESEISRHLKNGNEKKYLSNEIKHNVILATEKSNKNQFILNEISTGYEYDLKFQKIAKRKENYELQKDCPHCVEAFDSVNDIEEWLGFRYKDYIKQITAFVAVDEFINLKADNDIEESAGYFSQTQVDTLKDVLNNGFRKGQSINEISLMISKKVKPKDLFEITGASQLGNLIRKGENRSNVIARTEITRAANEGALSHFRDNGIQKVRWVASAGARTCPICEELNGQIFEINNHPEFPVHINCRCMTLPITELR